MDIIWDETSLPLHHLMESGKNQPKYIKFHLDYNKEPQIIKDILEIDFPSNILLLLATGLNLLNASIGSKCPMSQISSSVYAIIARLKQHRENKNAKKGDMA